MPELDLSAATGLRVAGKDAAEVRAANRTVWKAPEPPQPVFQVTFVTTAAAQVVTIALGGCGDGNTMDWGDGTTETFDAGAASGNAPLRTHTYAEPGTYQATYSGTFANIGSSSQPVASGDTGMNALRTVDRWDAATATADCSNAFSECHRLTSVASPPPTVTTMERMFRTSYRAGYTLDLSNWGTETTSRVTTMNNMFSCSTSGSVKFNGEIGHWDVSKVTDMGNMFRSAAGFNCDLSGWDTSRVISMSTMFQNATTFNQDLSAWDVSKVTDRANFNTGANPEWVANAAWQPQWPT